MVDLDQIRKHVLFLKANGIKMTGHRAMLARCLDEIDALKAALQEAALHNSQEVSEHDQTCNSFEWGVDQYGIKFPLECDCQFRSGKME